MDKLYTRSGDDGYTGLLGEGRVPKNHPRMQAIGNLDEVSAALGIVRATIASPEFKKMILKIQRDLYKVMAEVAATKENAEKFRTIQQKNVDWLEEQIRIISDPLTLPKEFIVPGDTISGAFISLARTVVRRAERSIANLYHLHELENQAIIQYINRLSSLCYALEMYENANQSNQSITLAKEKETE